MRWTVALWGAWLAFLVAGCQVTANGDGDERPGHDAAHDSSALPVITFTSAGGQAARLMVEVVDDDAERSCGLMHRTSLPDDHGMLFAYAQGGQLGGFWMRNTLIPLSIAYIAADGRIVDIQEMQPVPAPNTTAYMIAAGGVAYVTDGQPIPAGASPVVYPPRAAYQYAVEANAGWYARNGIAAGDTVDLQDAVPRAESAAPPPICRERGT